jgi:hypothetical protein
MTSKKNMSDIEKSFKISSPKPKPINLDSEEDFNDFHYWQDPIMEVEELRRLDSTMPRNPFGDSKAQKLDSNRLLDPTIGVNGTIRRVVDDKKPLEKKLVQKEEPKIHSITNVYVIQSNSNQRLEIPAPRPLVVPPQIPVPPAQKTQEEQPLVPIVVPQIQNHLVIIDGRVVDDGNFIQQQKYQYLVDGKSKDDSNFIEEQRYMILPNGERVPFTDGQSIAPEPQPKPMEEPARQDDAKRPMIHVIQPGVGASTPRNSSLPKRIETGFNHSTVQKSTPRSTSPRIPSGGRNSPPPSVYSAPRIIVPPPENTAVTAVGPVNALPTDGSHTTLHMEPIPTPAPKTKPDLFWWKKVQLLRALAFGIYTFVTTIQGLNDMRVSKIGGRPLLYALLVFSGIDMFFALVKAWPRKLWIFWDVRNWDAVF